MSRNEKFTKEQKQDFNKRIVEYERLQLEKVKQQQKKNDAGN